MNLNTSQKKTHNSAIFPKLVVFLIINYYCCIAMASDNAREHQYAIEIEKTTQVGNLIYLKSADNKFLALYLETESLKNQGTIILLHDQGQHPDQKYLINKLRTTLPQQNWATLALQMPLREIGAESEQYYPLFAEANQRIQAGIDYLRKNSVKNIVLLGYGLGGLMALFSINEQPGSITAIVTISLPVPETNHPAAQTLDYLKKITIPLLDIYGGKDTSEVSKSARSRRIAAKKNPDFRQFLIENASRSFLNHDDLVVKRVYSWLSQINRP